MLLCCQAEAPGDDGLEGGNIERRAQRGDAIVYQSLQHAAWCIVVHQNEVSGVQSIGEAGLVIGLVGPLGAGKTAFVKGLAEGLDLPPAVVSSPTFVIAQQYPISSRTPVPSGSDDALHSKKGPFVLHHVDLYRLESEDELDAIGFADLFESGAVLAVEWADRFDDVLGDCRLDIELDGPSAGEATMNDRHARVVARGVVAEAALEDWVQRAERISRAGARAGGEGLGNGPQLGWGWSTFLALCVFGLARVDIAEPEALCLHPAATQADALGTLRVECGAEREDGLPPSGLGGLLFGNPIELADVSTSQLEALPGIGPSRARAIVAARDERAFASIADLARVSGIGPKTVGALSGWLSAAGADPDSSRAGSRSGRADRALGAEADQMEADHG